MSYLQPHGAAIELGINIDLVAALRSAQGREGNNDPDLLQAALLAEDSGADGIIMFLQPDCQHISEDDVHAIRSRLLTNLSLKVPATKDMLDFCCRLKPYEVCLIPEFQEQDRIAGSALELVKHLQQVKAAVAQLQNKNIRVCLLVSAEPDQIDAAAETGAELIELHTGKYVGAQLAADREFECRRLGEAAVAGIRYGLKVQAGQGLNYANVRAVAAISQIFRLNVGHAIVSRAFFVGWQTAVAEMKALIVKARRDALQ